MFDYVSQTWPWLEILTEVKTRFYTWLLYHLEQIRTISNLNQSKLTGISSFINIPNYLLSFAHATEHKSV